MVLLSPSVSALRKLLRHCQIYANSKQDIPKSPRYSGVPIPKTFSAGSRPSSPHQRQVPSRPTSVSRNPSNSKTSILSKIQSAPNQATMFRPITPEMNVLDVIHDVGMVESSLEESECDSVLEVTELGKTTPAKLKLQRELACKKRDFLTFKKKFLPQQNTYMQMFITLKDIEQKLEALGIGTADMGLPKEMNVIDCGDWTTFDLAIFKEGHTVENFKSHIGSPVLFEIQTALSNVPDKFIALSAQLMNHRQETIEWIKSKMKNPGANFTQELKSKILKLSEETPQLHDIIGVAATDARKRVEKAIELAKTAWFDRDNLTQTIEQLQKDLFLATQKLKNTDRVPCNESKSSTIDQNLSKVELRENDDDKKLIKLYRDKMIDAEHKIRMAKSKICDLERELKEANDKEKTLNQKMKDLEYQLKHRETVYESRAKKLNEVSKAGESVLGDLTKQRDALEIRVNDLQKQLSRLQEETKQHEKELRETVESAQGRAQAEAAAKRAAADRERKMKEALTENEKLLADARAHCEKVLSFHKDNKTNVLPLHKQPTPHEREVQLYEELETTRKALIQANEEIQRCKNDKESFLETLSKIASCENNGTAQEKMAQQILEREKKVSELEKKLVSLETDKKKKEEAMNAQEKTIAELRFKVMSLRNYELNSEKSPIEDLEQQLLELHQKVAELTRERNDYKKSSIRSALMLERHQAAMMKQHELAEVKEHLLALMRPSDKGTKMKSEDHLRLSSLWKTASKTWSTIQIYQNRQKTFEDTIYAQHESLMLEQKARVELERLNASLMKKIAKSGKNEVCGY